jgi:hypothetical protein
MRHQLIYMVVSIEDDTLTIDPDPQTWTEIIQSTGVTGINVQTMSVQVIEPPPLTQ